MTDTQLIPYCALTSCLDCEHSEDCARFFTEYGKLPYLLYKPYISPETMEIINESDVPIPFPNRRGRKIKNAGRKKKK